MLDIRKRNKSIGQNIFHQYILPMILPILLVLFWQIGGDKGIINTNLIPTPSTLVSSFILNLTKGIIWKHLSISIVRVIVGFVIGAICGIVLGFCMGIWEDVNKALSIVVGILRPIPIIAIVPVLILLLGIGEQSKYAVIAIGSFWTILLNTIHGVQSVDKKLLEVSYTFRISKIKTIFKIILPAAVPAILTGVRLGISYAWMSVVAAEMVAASKGIGFLIMYSRDIVDTKMMYVSVIIIGLIGLFIDKGLTSAEKAYIKKSRGE